MKLRKYVGVADLSASDGSGSSRMSSSFQERIRVFDSLWNGQ